MRLERNSRAADDDVQLAVEPLGVLADQGLDGRIGWHPLADFAKAPGPFEQPPVTREPQIDLDEVASVRPRLGDQRPAFLGDQGLVLVPAQDHVDVRGRGEGLVLGHLHVRDRHHEAYAPRSEA